MYDDSFHIYKYKSAFHFLFVGGIIQKERWQWTIITTFLSFCFISGKRNLKRAFRFWDDGNAVPLRFSLWKSKLELLALFHNNSKFIKRFAFWNAFYYSYFEEFQNYSMGISEGEKGYKKMSTTWVLQICNTHGDQISVISLFGSFQIFHRHPSRLEW